MSTVPPSPVLREISEHARLCPYAAALRGGGQVISCVELLRRANHFAHSLQSHAPVRGKAVAVIMDRSPEWIITALGIMLSGAGYVPLDPSWPDARLRFAIADSDAVALIANRSLLERIQGTLPGIDPCAFEWPTVDSPSLTADLVSQQSNAYIIYTSGSTGRPKGVEITHANLAHLASWHRDAFQVSFEDRVSHLASVGFDAAAWEIWPTLSAGATLCIPPDSIRRSPREIQKWMLQEGITIGFVPTAHAAVMMEMDWPASTPLRLLLTGGDVLRNGPRKRLPFAVINNYGPTECTVVATSSIVAAFSEEVPSIGRPIAGTSVYLLDENCEQVPDGSPGEIYIGGSGVGAGYRNLPELTKETFLADRFSEIPAARMYRTGDRGIRKSDGEICFLGRFDRQVQIRGCRVELEEISNVLSRHPSVAFSDVVIRTLTSGETQLVAYVLPTGALPEPTATHLRTYLSQYLPDYMVPALFVNLVQVPLSASGKVDRFRLPPPSETNLLPVETTTTRATPLERQLLTIIGGLLDGNAIGVKDNFFLSGGDSLLGMQLIIMLREEFGVELTFDQIFEASTVEGLAALIDIMRRQHIGGGTNNNPPKTFLQVDNTCGTTHLSHDDKDCCRFPANQASQMPSGVLMLPRAKSCNTIFWIHYLDLSLSKALGDDQQLVFLRLAPDELKPLGETPSFEHIASLFVQKILATQIPGQYIIGGLCIGGLLAYEVAVQLQRAQRPVASVVLVDCPSPSYLTLAHPLSAKLSNPGYLIRRAVRLGLRATMLKIRDRLLEPFSQLRLGILSTKGADQTVIEVAASAYRGTPYNGRVLLILASRRAPHVDFLPEWKVLANNLDVRYIDCHHDDLTKPRYAHALAKELAFHLECAGGSGRRMSTSVHSESVSAAGD